MYGRPSIAASGTVLTDRSTNRRSIACWASNVASVLSRAREIIRLEVDARDATPINPMASTVNATRVSTRVEPASA
jgi:hypothetical protein